MYSLYRNIQFIFLRNLHAQFTVTVRTTSANLMALCLLLKCSFGYNPHQTYIPFLFCRNRILFLFTASDHGRSAILLFYHNQVTLTAKSALLIILTIDCIVKLTFSAFSQCSLSMLHHFANPNRCN